MYFKCSLIACLLILSFKTFSQDNTRTYDEVKNEFVRNYYFESSESTLKFAKKQQDWYLVVTDYFNKKPPVEFLFWNSKIRRYEAVDFQSNTTGDMSNIHETGIMDEYYYRFMPFYGYNGYYADNINYLRNKQNRSDDELYCLARAYSEYAGNLLRNQYGTGLQKYSFNKNFYKQNSLSPQETTTYLAYQDSCLRTYQKLTGRSPNYNTHIVGSASNKMYNEYLYRYMNLCMNVNDKTALAGLPQNLYNDFSMGYAKNFLDACPKNAILFTEGDNDTYPILYYQKSKHYREDITVVNVPLLGIEIYSNYLNDTRQVPFSFYFTEDNKNQILYTLFKEGSDSTLTLQEYIKQLKDTLLMKESSFYGKLPELNCREILIESKNEVIRIPLKRTFYRNENLVLDILNTQLSKRPISMTGFMEDDGILSYLKPYSSYNGFVYNLENFGTKRNTSVPLDEFVKRITIPSYYHIPGQPLRSDSYISDAYKGILTRVCGLCLEARDTAKAKLILNFYLSQFPFDKFKLSVFDLNFVVYYKELYGWQKASAILSRFEKLIRKEEYIVEGQREEFVDLIRETYRFLN